MSKCTGLFGKLFGHSYDHIYSENVKQTSVDLIKEATSGAFCEDIPRIIGSLVREKTYKCSICARCGDTVKTGDSNVECKKEEEVRSV